MDINKEYSCLEQNCVVYQKCLENDEDYQESLPGYCDDVFRVVKCTSKSYITSTNIEFGEIKLFGRTQICLTYLNENSNLCYCDFEEEFSKSVEIDGLTDQAFVQTNLSTKYTTFRVINQRKISIHNTTSVKLTVYDKTNCSCIKSCEKSKLRLNEIKCAAVIDCVHGKIEFDEEVSLANDGCSINQIISSSSFVTLDEIKIIKDKALIKGTVNARLLYIQEGSETVSKYDTSFSVSKIIDSSGIADTDIPIARLSVGNLYYKLKTNKSNDIGGIELFGDISTDVVFLRENTFTVVTDGYMLKNKCQCTYNEINCKTDGKLYADKITDKISIKTSNPVKELLEIELTPQGYEVKDGCIVCYINSNVLYITNDDELISNYTTEEFKIKITDCDEAIVGLNIEKFDFTLSAEQCVDVRLTLNVNAYLYKNSTVKILSEIFADDDKINSPALTVYFANQNESVWSIAKAFASDTDLIIKENNLSSDIIDCNRTIIIPGV